MARKLGSKEVAVSGRGSRAGCPAITRANTGLRSPLFLLRLRRKDFSAPSFAF
jgi:hypothetical protein